MVRRFRPDPVDRDDLDALLAYGLGGPSAGNSRSLHLVVLEGAEVDRYWNTTLPPDRRHRFPWPGLLQAPVLILVYVEPEAYLNRYAEPDKAHTGLGGGEDRWSVPYWWVDGGAAVENVLLGAVAHGLGACLFGQFELEQGVRAEFGVPETMRAVGTVAIGHPAADDRPSRSGLRGRPDPARHVHRGQW